MHAHIHPSSTWFALRRARDAVDQRFQARSPALVSSLRAITVPRAPWPLQGVTPSECHISCDIDRHYSIFFAHMGSCARPKPSRSLGLSPVPRVFAGCCVPLLGVGLSRRYLLNLSLGAWTRTPPRSSGARARFFPDDIGLTSVSTGSARRNIHHDSNFYDGHRFRGCSHALMFRLPYLRGLQVAPTATAL